VRPAIIVFAKAPVPGRVKTRLAASIGPAAAARLYAEFVARMLETLAAWPDLADIEIHTDTPTNVWDAYGFPRRLQAAGALSLKLFHALDSALRRGHPAALVAGSDSPTLPAGYLQELLESKADVSFGPCEDGGYYAVAARRVHPRMFDGVAWSGPSALGDNENACRACGLTVWRGPGWYDIDTVEDLRRL
jgi:rSAM/selenodomain-associated transferase 1